MNVTPLAFRCTYSPDGDECHYHRCSACDPCGGSSCPHCPTARFVPEQIGSEELDALARLVDRLDWEREGWEEAGGPVRSGFTEDRQDTCWYRASVLWPSDELLAGTVWEGYWYPSFYDVCRQCGCFWGEHNPARHPEFPPEPF